MLSILSIDVGTLNPSIVLIIINNRKIISIQEFNLNISNTTNIIKNFDLFLKNNNVLDYVIIEKQSPKNIKCLQISYSLEMYFKLKTNAKVTIEIPVSKRKYKKKNLLTRKEKKDFSLNLAKERLISLKFKIENINLTHDFADAFNIGYDKYISLIDL